MLAAGIENAVMALYSLLLLAVLLFGAPYWLLRMATSGRYRAGLWDRLGRVPPTLRTAIAGRQVIWLHAVSVGEVLAATRLLQELETALGEGWIIVVSTTTATGQALASRRFGANSQPPKVFYYPLDFAWVVRAYLHALQPRLLILMESELWPRMLIECRRGAIPVAVVNARVSDRSFARGIHMRAIWGKLLRSVTLFLAQSAEDARRLIQMGARTTSVRVTGNLKYDVRAQGENRMTERIASLLGNNRLLIAGSTLEGEEKSLLAVWPAIHAAAPDTALMIAPRHPDRFPAVLQLARQTASPIFPCSQLLTAPQPIPRGAILLLDTVGDLASTYRLAAAAFIGGSLVQRGGHNPLEPAQFAVPVVMGPSVENFRDIVARLRSSDAIRIVPDQAALELTLIDFLTNTASATAIGERARRVFEDQQGATARAVEALVAMVQP